MRTNETFYSARNELVRPPLFLASIASRTSQNICTLHKISSSSCCKTFPRVWFISRFIFHLSGSMNACAEHSLWKIEEKIPARDHLFYVRHLLEGRSHLLLFTDSFQSNKLTWLGGELLWKVISHRISALQNLKYSGNARTCQKYWTSITQAKKT